jgi:glycosyltransferase involved in cell wall biosynthesis
MSRILLSAYACEPGKGSEPEVGWMWATELASAGHEVWVLTREANRKAIEGRLEQRRIPGLQFVYFDLPQWARRWKRGGAAVHCYYALWQWGAYLVARRLKKSVPLDCVQHVTFVGLRGPSFMGWLGLPFVLGPVSGGERVPRQVRSRMSTRSKLTEWIREIANRAVRVDPVMRHGFRKAERILVTSAESKRLIPEEFRAKCEVQLGVGLSREYLGWSGPGQRTQGPACRLLYAGRLLEWKGVDLALKAVQAARAEGAAVRLTIVGQGPAEDELRKLAAALELDECVRWMKWVPQTELKRLYHEHDALLFPSLRDSGGMVVLEAMAHGLPVVCTDCGGPGMIVNERSGRVVAAQGKSPQQVVDALASAVIALSKNRCLLQKLSRGARSRAWAFDFHRVVTRVHPVERGEGRARPMQTNCTGRVSS